MCVWCVCLCGIFDRYLGHSFRQYSACVCSECVCVACQIGMCDIAIGSIVRVCVVIVSVWHVGLVCVT